MFLLGGLHSSRYFSLTYCSCIKIKHTQWTHSIICFLFTNLWSQEGWLPHLCFFSHCTVKFSCLFVSWKSTDNRCTYRELAGIVLPIPRARSMGYKFKLPLKHPFLPCASLTNTVSSLAKGKGTGKDVLHHRAGAHRRCQVPWGYHQPWLSLHSPPGIFYHPGCGQDPFQPSLDMSVSSSKCLSFLFSLF